MSKHSKIYNQISKILAEEWRDDLKEIIRDLKQKREDKITYTNYNWEK